MLVTPAGNAKLVKPVQFWNALTPIVLTLFGIEIDVKEALLHPLNALSLIKVNDVDTLTNVTVVRLVHPSNAELFMPRTPMAVV